MRALVFRAPGLACGSFFLASAAAMFAACDGGSTEPEPPPGGGEISVRITRPQQAARVARGDLVPLSAVVESESASPGRFVSWSSDLQGRVAVGDSVEVSHLVPGEHVLTAAVMRFDLRLASDSVRVSVEDRTSKGMRVVGRLDPGGGGFSDLWLDGGLLALGTRFRREVFLIDVSSPAAPRLAGTVATLGGGQDVQLSGGHLYLETGAVFDVRDPARPRVLPELPVDAYDVFVTEGRFYGSLGGGTPGSGIDGDAGDAGESCPGSLFGGPVEVFDVSDPARPRRLGAFTERGVAHELQEVDGILYGAFCGGFCAVDVSDPGAPRLLGCGSRGTHSAFRHASSPLVFTTDEFDPVLGTDPAVRVWDVTSLADPRLLAVYQSIPPSPDHQVWAEGDFLAVAGYGKGVEVVDVSDPARPRLTAFYDTFPGAANTFDGAWGVVMTPDGIVYASDTATGLWILAVE